MKIEVTELSDKQLNKFVALAQEWKLKKTSMSKTSLMWTLNGDDWIFQDVYTPTTNPSQAFELLQTDAIEIENFTSDEFGKFKELTVYHKGSKHSLYTNADTFIIAVCRAFVTAEFGEYVEVEE